MMAPWNKRRSRIKEIKGDKGDQGDQGTRTTRIQGHQGHQGHQRHQGHQGHQGDHTIQDNSLLISSKSGLQDALDSLQPEITSESTISCKEYLHQEVLVQVAVVLML